MDERIINYFKLKEEKEEREKRIQAAKDLNLENLRATCKHEEIASRRDTNGVAHLCKVCGKWISGYVW